LHPYVFLLAPHNVSKDKNFPIIFKNLKRHLRPTLLFSYSFATDCTTTLHRLHSSLSGIVQSRVSVGGLGGVSITWWEKSDFS